MKKKILALLLAVLMVVSLFPVTALANGIFYLTNGTTFGNKETNHGYIKVSEGAREGENAVVEVYPNEGYELKTLTVVPTEGGTAIETTQDKQNTAKYTFTMPASDVTVTAEFEAAPAWTGSGTEEAPYQIGTLDDLNELATEVSGGQDMSGVYFKLTADIGDATTPFTTPIGNYTNQFKGNFDGDGHTVHLTVSGSSYLGLFGCLNGGSIKNVTTAGTVGNQKAANINLAAGVCARNIGGTIENCVNKAAVSCGNYGNGMGGICGLNEGGTINGCSNTAMIKAWGINAKYFGGICGQNYTGSILNCVNSGEVKALEWAINMAWAASAV